MSNNANRARRQVRKSRALGIALTPKAEKYFERRPYGPGEHGRARRKQDSDYKVRLLEKQRLRAQYNIREKQMHRAYVEAKRREGMTGENLVRLLESRLDALVLRAGFARTMSQARQLVVHRHIMVDGQRVDRPSYIVKPGQMIHVHSRSEKMAPPYLDVAIDKLQATYTRLPERSEVPVTCEEQLVVEYYARMS